MDKRGKLILAMLIASTGLSAGAVSFSLAWYANASTVGVRYIQMDIRAERALEIKRTEEEYSEYTSGYDRKDLNQVAVFDAVSTMFEGDWNGENAAEPTFFTYKAFFVPDSGVPYREAMHGGFLMQHFYLKADDDVYVGLDPLLCSVTPDEAFNLSRANALHGQKGYEDFTVEEIYQRLNALQNAMRVSVYDVSEHQHYIFDPHKEGETYYGGILDNDGEDLYFDYYTKDGISKEVVYGEFNDPSLIRYKQTPLEEDIPLVGERTCFNAGHKKGVYVFDEEASYLAGLRFKEEPSIDWTTLPTDSRYKENPFILKCYRGEPKEIVVSMYLEGWDKDCVNAIMGASFHAQVQFKIVREM